MAVPTFKGKLKNYDWPWFSQPRSFIHINVFFLVANCCTGRLSNENKRKNDIFEIFFHNFENNEKMGYIYISKKNKNP